MMGEDIYILAVSSRNASNGVLRRGRPPPDDGRDEGSSFHRCPSEKPRWPPCERPEGWNLGSNSWFHEKRRTKALGPLIHANSKVIIGYDRRSGKSPNFFMGEILRVG